MQHHYNHHHGKKMKRKRSSRIRKQNVTRALKKIKIKEIENKINLNDYQLDVVGKRVDKKVGSMWNRVEEIADMIMFPEIHGSSTGRLNIKRPTGVLLYGPPGTGKTMTTREVIKRCKSRFGVSIGFHKIDCSRILSKWVGESEVKLAEVFQRNYATKYTILFFDEIDAMAPIRKEKTTGGNNSGVGILSTFLVQMDGLSYEEVEQTTNEKESDSVKKKKSIIFVIGATNKITHIDPALIRNGRFTKLIEYNYPTSGDILNILTYHTRTWALDSETLKKIVEMMKDKIGKISGAYIKDICNSAGSSILSIARKISADSAVVTGDNKLLLDKLLEREDVILTVFKNVIVNSRLFANSASNHQKNGGNASGSHLNEKFSNCISSIALSLSNVIMGNISKNILSLKYIKSAFSMFNVGLGDIVNSNGKNSSTYLHLRKKTLVELMKTFKSPNNNGGGGDGGGYTTITINCMEIIEDLLENQQNNTLSNVIEKEVFSFIGGCVEKCINRIVAAQCRHVFIPWKNNSINGIVIKLVNVMCCTATMGSIIKNKEKNAITQIIEKPDLFRFIIVGINKIAVLLYGKRTIIITDYDLDKDNDLKHHNKYAGMFDVSLSVNYTVDIDKIASKTLSTLKNDVKTAISLFYSELLDYGCSYNYNTTIVDNESNDDSDNDWRMGEKDYYVTKNNNNNNNNNNKTSNGSINSSSSAVPADTTVVNEVIKYHNEFIINIIESDEYKELHGHLDEHCCSSLFESFNDGINAFIGKIRKRMNRKKNGVTLCSTQLNFIKLFESFINNSVPLALYPCYLTGSGTSSSYTSRKKSAKAKSKKVEKTSTMSEVDSLTAAVRKNKLIEYVKKKYSPTVSTIAVSNDNDTKTKSIEVEDVCQTKTPFRQTHSDHTRQQVQLLPKEITKLKKEKKEIITIINSFTTHTSSKLSDCDDNSSSSSIRTTLFICRELEKIIKNTKENTSILLQSKKESDVSLNHKDIPRSLTKSLIALKCTKRSIFT